MSNRSKKDEVKQVSPAIARPILCVVFIDEYGLIVAENKSKYTVTLNGDYSWSYLANAWWHYIEKIEPKIPLSGVLHDKLLVAK